MDGFFHGYGILKYSNGNQYEGEWKSNYAHGDGTFTSNDGFEYKGNFNEGKYDYDGNMRYTRSADFIGNKGELYNNGIERGPIKLFDPPPIKK